MANSNVMKFGAYQNLLDAITHVIAMMVPTNHQIFVHSHVQLSTHTLFLQLLVPTQLPVEVSTCFARFVCDIFFRKRKKHYFFLSLLHEPWKYDFFESNIVSSTHFNISLSKNIILSEHESNPEISLIICYFLYVKKDTNKYTFCKLCLQMHSSENYLRIFWCISALSS